MANILLDGSVLPSYMNVESMGQSSRSTSFGNVALRQGEVRSIIYPSDPQSVNKKVVEYAVAVQFQEGSGPAVTVMYPNCIVANLLGGMADKSRYTLRAADKEPVPGQTTGNGSKVLLLCVNGETRRAYIISGINENSVSESKEDGHNSFKEFNGIQTTINKDGELQIRFTGATKTNGSLLDGVDPEASGSTVIFTKEGGIKAYTADSQQFIHLDHKNKQLDILADELWNVKVNEKLAFDIGDTVAITGGSTCTIEMQDKVFIKSPGVYVGGAGEFWMMGSTYRQNEQTMHQTMVSMMTNLSSLLAMASTSLKVAASLQQIPVAGPIAASGPLQVAASALSSAGTAFSQLASAISQFEGGAAKYLSKKNKND